MHNAYYRIGWHMLKQDAHCLLQNWVAHLKRQKTLSLLQNGFAQTHIKTKHKLIITKWSLIGQWRDELYMTLCDYCC